MFYTILGTVLLVVFLLAFTLSPDERYEIRDRVFGNPETPPVDPDSQ